MPTGIYKRKFKAKRHNMGIYAASRKKETAPHWKGGVIYTMGYRWIYKPEHPNANFNRVYVAEHRLIMSEHLKRPLLSSEIVHHINGNGLDNRLENLAIVSRKIHNNIHHGNPSPKTRLLKRELAYARKDPKTGRFC